jgi:Zn finger protein HypA/HybF involved in hydrogenase expression
MANGGMLCQDCHGDMQQVGDDFTRTVGEPDGGFELAADFYTNPDTPRVPWANEPGCGSCHTGDALDNMHSDADTLGSPSDDIRLMQAFRTDDAKATPIVPSNTRFAENIVTTGDAAGNPKLYRVSKGHEGVFCEGCHGATHGIWPNKNPDANDNVTATQLQGHTGTITECDTCHTGGFDIDHFKSSVSGGGDMGGPHGMHPVNDPMWNDKHKEVFELNKNSCRTCHGADGKGTVLSTTATNRTFECKNEDGNWAACRDGSSQVTVDAGTVVGCDNCHSMEN